MRKWDDLPAEMRNAEVRYYYNILCKKKFSLAMKRLLDIVASATMIVVLSPIFVILSIAIKLDSHGPVFYRQERLTAYAKRFRIHKFRTMVENADKNGSSVTVMNDSRVTRVGKLIRKCRLDEIGQLIDVLQGNMTFVGTRPEVIKYVRRYTPEMMATFLLPAGITSEASILYMEEEKLLDGVADIDEVYINNVLPKKMHYNLRSIEQFSFWRDIGTMFKTVLAVLGGNKEELPDMDPEDLKQNADRLS